MKLSQAINGNGILLASFLFLLELSLCSFPQFQVEKTLPHVTWDVEEVSGKSFDYIIVGGGTTGCPLAATLSDKFSVLVIERGDSPYGNPLIMEKSLYGLSLLETNEFSSIAQGFVSEDGVPNLRGRVLGGSSAINGGFYSRASEDFVKRAGWDEKAVKEAYEWIESKVVFKPELTPWQAVVEFGFLEAGILPYNGYSLEHVEGTKIGASVIDSCGKRHSSADLLGAGNPENITVLLNATVKNVIFRSKGNKSERRAHGIRFIQSEGNSHKTHRAYLNPNSSGDVILSAGSLGSPQILMLSGIGSFKHLSNFDLPLVVDLDRVGHGMKDNPGVAVLVDSEPRKRQPDTPQVVGVADDYRVIVEAGIVPTSPNETRVPIAAKLAFPLSEGSLKLNNTDPRKNPSVRFNYLAEEADLKGCVRLVKLLKKVERSRAVAVFWGVEKKRNNLMVSSEEEARNFCKRNVRTFYHYHGGCLVGSVVDKDYKVFGVKGLRVLDGSTLSESPGTNPMATLLMLGRYHGLKILEERKNYSNIVTESKPY